MKYLRLAAFAAASTLVLPAHARITEINVQKVEPFANGATFGNAGAYERVWGVAKGELDPNDARNKVIVNLDKAPRNSYGKVEYEVEWFMLRPADASKGNHKLLFEVTNRGRKFLMNWIMDAPAQAAGAVNDPKTAKDAGNALFFRQGWTMAWTGWDPDAPKTSNGMAMKAPVVPNLTRVIRDELVNGTRAPQAGTFRLSYEAATTEPDKSRLTMRRKEKDPRVEIPSSGWAFANTREITLLPVGTKPEPGTLYELHYPAKDPKVLGIGFAATRDFVSFLRNEANDDAFQRNPADRGLQKVIATGISQSGRYLRDFVQQGFNQDEGKRRVFDGVLTHISGIGGVFLNAEFGQPARTNTQHEDHYFPENQFPFSAAKTADPVTKKSGALLRGDGFDPLWIEVNTSTEYWQKGASLLHTDPLGRQDLRLPANARVFMISGTQHGGRADLKPDFGPCMNPRNPHSPAPALRALLVALDAWVSQGRPPPASRVPTLSAKTLVNADKTGFPRIPGIAVADFVNSVALFGDWVNPKETAPSPYRSMVARVASDGNEIAGLRLPDIEAPLATYTGWNLYKAPFTEGELCDRDGSYSPLPATQKERMDKGDPRPSLEERYGTHAGYVKKVEAAARTLVRDRLLLAEDAERYLKAAREESVAKLFAR
jgi:hypothetical protein